MKLQTYLDSMTQDERGLLLYLESRATDQGGLVDLKHMSSDDVMVATEWNDTGFIKFGRLTSESVQRLSGSTHWCELSDNAWELAHRERRNRYKRLNSKRSWQTTAEKRENDRS